jgi:ketosteroid isomerase-like protein
MQTQEAPVQEAAPTRPETKHRNRTPWFIAAAVVLGLIAVGLVMWAFDDDASDPQLETVTELVNTMHEGLNENDVDTFTSVFTDDAVWVWENAVPVSSAFGSVPSGYTWERVSEVTELGHDEQGDESYTFVHEFGDEIITRAVVVVDFDGELMSRAEWVSGPFDYEVPAD